MPAAIRVSAGYFFVSSVTTTISCAPSAATCRAILSTVKPPSMRLAAGHRDGIVEENLEGDVDVGGATAQRIARTPE